MDEDGNQTIEFKNGEGQVLLVRKMLSATEKADTYYVYNEYNQLAFVIPPKGAVATDPNTVLLDLCYQYRYDGRNRLVEKKLPGKGWEYMVYDKQDRLVLTRDAVLEAQGKWLFTKYDQFSRPIYTGILDSPPGRSQQVAAVEGLGSNNETRTAAPNFNNTGMDVYYTTNSAYPQYNYVLLSVNYYDTYPSYSFNPAFPTTILGQTLLTDTPTTEGLSTKSLPVMSLVKNIEDDNWTKNYTYYDKKGRSVGSYSINHLGGRTKVESKLDFAGVVQQSITRHKRLDSDTDKVITEKFIYDQQNRLLSHTHQVDNNPVEYLAQNSYNELSQLSGKKVGGISPSTPLQDISYSYNIRGWMTQINDPNNLNGKLFGYKINYNQVEGLETPDALTASLQVKPKYNGNIAEVSWKTLTEENEPLKRYGYVYDRLNRLSAGFYQRSGQENSLEYFEKAEYDLNGNITRLKRSEGLVAGSTTAMMIDNLKYDYTGNRLTKVTEEQIGNSKGYPYIAVPNEIKYDNGLATGNGNMTAFVDKGISSIQYNYLNLPKKITQNTKVTDYIYRADGTKVKKLFGDIETNYLDGFQYKSTYQVESWNGEGTFHPDPNEVPVLKLRIIPTAEGYYDALLNKYVYHYTDHLGNIRLSYTDTNNDGTIQPRRYNASNCTGKFCLDDWRPGEIVEVNNYYPFGLLHNYTATSGNAYQYKYQGQELQETGFYSFKWRNYMPDIGRFFNIDPLSEKYPTWAPYVFSGNRVIDARELEGLEPHVLFNTRENAAANFGQQYNGRSILQKREYAAIIYVKVVEGKKYYAYNRPARGGAHGVTTDQLNKYIPKGTVPTAIAHTHGNDDYGPGNNYDDQNFSDNDKNYAGDLKLDAFLVTPEGSLKYYDLSSGTEKTVRTDMPSDPDNETPRVNNINPILNPNPSLGDYRPKPKPFPNFEPISNDKPKPTLDNGLKSIEDMNTRKQQSPLINRTGLEYIQ